MDPHAAVPLDAVRFPDNWERWHSCDGLVLRAGFAASTKMQSRMVVSARAKRSTATAVAILLQAAFAGQLR